MVGGKPMPNKIKLLLMVFFVSLFFNGCSSFGKGVVEGLLENSEKEDKRACQIWSKGFEGIGASIEKTQGKTKVLMVHGVGSHIPGYSTILLEKLSQKLDLPLIDIPFKELTISEINDPSKNLGNLRLNRLISRDKERELLFYELTWSRISQSEKEVLNYDNSGLYSFRRANVNNALKKFSNDSISDPMIYLGEKQEDIQKSVIQSVCWMISYGWNTFPSGEHKLCQFNSPGILENAKKDDYIFISHSLGSRITIDALQKVVGLVNNKNVQKKFPEVEKLHHEIQNRVVTIFMFSNQLPLLQLGRPLPEILNENDKYCLPNGSHFSDRFANQTHIIAFSDPNDLLSYSIPAGFENNYLDSRMCTKVSNVSINVAHVVDVFGVSEVANPIEAHVGYDSDDRVVELVAHGLNNQNITPIIKERCKWMELVK